MWLRPYRQDWFRVPAAAVSVKGLVAVVLHVNDVKEFTSVAAGSMVFEALEIFEHSGLFQLKMLVVNRGRWTRDYGTVWISDVGSGLTMTLVAQAVAALVQISAHLGRTPSITGLEPGHGVVHFGQIPLHSREKSCLATFAFLPMVTGGWLHATMVIDRFLVESMHSTLQSFACLIGCADGISGGGPPAQEAQMITQLATLLRDKGVPAERAEERVSLGLKKIGIQELQAAMSPNNPCVYLKSI